jgi:hypothetical protein
MNIKLLIGVLILVLATCSIYNPTPRGSGIEGQVLIGPNQPYQATITVKSLSGVQIMQFQTDEQGHFSVTLVPGEYILHPESPNGIPFAGDQSFVVETGQYTRLTVNYDSGIR